VGSVYERLADRRCNKELVDVVMLDPNSSNPAPPDLECCLVGGSQFFDLGEVIQEDIASDWAPKNTSINFATTRSPDQNAG
jgi:hypothetical protein